MLNIFDYRYSSYPHIFFTIFLAINLAVIHYLNDGVFAYGFDDPYISMELARNISQGHYGLQGEVVSPASSIIWPFILAPFSGFKYFVFIPLIFNVLFSFGQILVLQKVMLFTLAARSKECESYIAVASISFVLGFNMTGISLLGMEHSLQILIAMLLAYGAIMFVEESKIRPWMLTLVMAAGAVRYELLAVVGALVFVMFFSNHKTKAVMYGLVSLIIPVIFSFLLDNLGLNILPNSVLIKSFIYHAYHLPIIHNLATPAGIIIGVFLSIITYSIVKNKVGKKERLLLLSVAAVFVAHIVLSDAEVRRYVEYTFAYAVLVFIYSYRKYIDSFLELSSVKENNIRIAIGILCFMYPFVSFSLFYSPLSSRDTYLKQHQVMRFVRDYYKKPVGLNDIGYADFYQDNYVLDFVGLANESARKFVMLEDRRFGDAWMEPLAKEKDVEMAIIFPSWFERFIPEKWEHLATLEMPKTVYSAHSESLRKIAFYYTGGSDKQRILEQLDDFGKTVPKSVKFTMEQDFISDL